MMMYRTRPLQIAVCVLSLVPLIVGGDGILRGTRSLGAEAVPDLDSHFRYLSGLLFAIGIGFLSAVPRICSQGKRIRLLAGLVFIGGLARLFGIITMVTPSWSMMGGLMMELVVTPLLALWQWQLARQHNE